MDIARDLPAALASFSGATRLYRLAFKEGGRHPDLNLGSSGLLVEAFVAIEQLDAVGARDIIVLCSNDNLKLEQLLGRQATLQISLADGSVASFTGLVSQAAMLGVSDIGGGGDIGGGNLARYRLRLVSLLWPLSQCRTSCAWQDKSVLEIVEAVLGRYPALAAWRWSDEVPAFMLDTRPRSYCAQYRESDLDFIARLLRAEGLAWRIEEDDAAPAGHRLVFFADSTRPLACPEDATSAAKSGESGGIRYHGARAGVEQDSIDALCTATSFGAASVTTLSYDYKTKKIIAASVPTKRIVGGQRAPHLESYDAPGAYAYASAAEAERSARLQMEAIEARSRRWQARSTVRTLRPGTRLTLVDGPLMAPANSTTRQQGDCADDYVVLRVLSVGINNLPTAAAASLAELLGPLPALLEECLQQLAATENAAGAEAAPALDRLADDARLPAIPGFALDDIIQQARAAGYANCVDMIAAATPYRPALLDESGNIVPAKPTAHGSQSAIVVGIDGHDRPNGADEICCDRLGRVRIRFHWQGGDQGDERATCWVRVAQRSAGAGMGAQFLPRIGQEVLVHFLENDIDRPIIVGSLYNGQGEGGVVPTPGGQANKEADLAVFSVAHDHRASGQGNLAGGNSPAWHGASGDSAGQRNGAAQFGMRSKEFGGSGYNQLLFDDTDKQGRIQLKSTQAASELNLGHLIHGADNYRGSLRGLGAELRTDGYGAVRAGAGLLVSTYKLQHNATARDPAGDNAPGLAHLKQAVLLAETFSQAAVTHRTVGYASHLGAAKAGACLIDDKAAPIKALYQAAAGMLDETSIANAKNDAAQKNHAPAAGKIPHSLDAIIALAARGGLGLVAGQDLQFANGETATFISGQDSAYASGGQIRIQTGQAIGMLGGVVKPGEGDTGLQLIAAKQAIDLQAQSDAITIQARDEINVISAHAHIDWAAAKSITLSTAGGANITIEGGNITVQCPGKILIQAGVKSFIGPTSMGLQMPVLPRGSMKFDEKFQLLDPAGDPIKNMRYAIFKDSGGRIEGITDDQGMIPLQQGFSPENLKIQILGRIKNK